MHMHPSAVVHLLLLVAAAAATSQAQLPPAAAAAAGRGRHATGAAACVPSERDALLAFKRGITGDPAGRLASWHEGDEDCCRWSGVRCSNQTGHVVGLHLGNSMYIDDPRLLLKHTALSGQISPSLLSLHHLESLDLSLNNLSGPAGRLPEFLGLLNNLRYLDLSTMPLFGRVPPQLGNLSNLHYLDLSPSTSEYDVPWSFSELYSMDISWLLNLPLMYLNMDSVVLNGTLDWAHVVNMLPSLKVLGLSYCGLTSANQSLPHLNLTDLVELDLSKNHFGHPVASCWFWNLTSLQHLGLSSTSLYGQIPDALGGMMSLQALDLSSSSSSMDIMTANMTNLCKLERIDFTGSDFDGSITDLFERLPQCSSNKLKELYLGYNSFSAVLPNHIGQWARLVTLDLFDNQITGQVTSEIGMLSNLVTLDLSTNQITGQMPSEIGMLSNLVTLDLYGNHLSGPVPSELGALNNLVELDLRDNNLDGVITQQHFAGLKTLKYIDLSLNSLKIAVDPEWLPPFRLESAYFASCQMGPLFPTWLQSQVNILELDMSNTSIFDRLPDWFATTFSKATSLSFSNNEINGTLPTNLENMKSLQFLYLDSNQLTGPIPLLPVNILVLDISRNHLSGQLPSNICDLNVHALNLANNRLEGKFPVCNQQRRASILILHNNMLSGKLEPILEVYRELQVLDLAWNNFTGSIAATITCLGGLFHLNLAGNSISGTLPHDLSNLRGMKTVCPTPYYDDYESRNLSMTMKGQERYYYSSTFFDIVTIDLSSNHLTGGIPEEIASLYAIVNLNLSRNNLTGKILERIGVMQSLESLDLSRNNLYGEIPQSLSNITSLSSMDLSQNNLTGRIPSGTQLDTIYAQNPLIYDGNVGLCGHPLPKNCTDYNRKPKHGNQKTDEHVVLTFSFGLGVGYVSGLWVVFCFILFNKSWWIAHFHLFDKAFDKVYVFVVVTWARWAKQTITN